MILKTDLLILVWNENECNFLKLAETDILIPSRVGGGLPYLHPPYPSHKVKFFFSAI